MICASRYSCADVNKIRSLMGRYFGNILDSSVIEDRLISQHDLCLNEWSVWSDNAVINRRRCIEASTHLVEANLLDDAINEICNMESICACSKVGEGFNLLKNLNILHNKLMSTASSNSLIQRVDSYMRWLGKDMTSIVQNPAMQIVATCTAHQPVVSHARSDMLKYLQLTYTSTEVGSGKIDSSQLGETFNSSAWVRGFAFESYQDFSAELSIYRGHSGSVLCLAMSVNHPQGCVIASGSVDNCIIVWNSESGSCLNRLVGHDAPVTSLSFQPAPLEGRSSALLCSGSCDNTVKIWDTETGSIILSIPVQLRFSLNIRLAMRQTLLGFGSDILHIGDGIYCVHFGSDCRTIAVGCIDGAVRLYNLNGDSIADPIKCHKVAVISVEMSPCGEYLLSVGLGEQACITSWRECRTVALPKMSSGDVLCSKYSNKGDRVAVGVENVSVHDAKSGSVSLVLMGDAMILSVSWSAGDEKILASDVDQSIRKSYCYSKNEDLLLNLRFFQLCGILPRGAYYLWCMIQLLYLCSFPHYQQVHCSIYWMISK